MKLTSDVYAQKRALRIARTQIEPEMTSKNMRIYLVGRGIPRDIVVEMSDAECRDTLRRVG